MLKWQVVTTLQETDWEVIIRSTLYRSHGPNLNTESRFDPIMLKDRGFVTAVMEQHERNFKDFVDTHFSDQFERTEATPEQPDTRARPATAAVNNQSGKS